MGYRFCRQIVYWCKTHGHKFYQKEKCNSPIFSTETIAVSDVLPDVFSAIFTTQETRAAQSLTLLGKPMVCVTAGILNTNVIGSLYRLLIF